MLNMRSRHMVHVLRSGLLALGLWAGMAAAQAPQRSPTDAEIEYGYPDQSIFIATVNAKGQVDSPMNRVAEALMERLGLPMRAIAYPAPRLFNNLQNGSTHFSILVRATQLEACCLFSRQPVYSTDLNVYSIGDKPPIKSKDDLVGRRVITIRGYSYGGLLKFISDPVNNIVNEAAGTHKAAFDMLKAERADYLIDYASAANDILAEAPIRALRTNSIDRLDIFLVLNKSYPQAERLMQRLEEAVKTLNVAEVLRAPAPR